MYVSETVVIWDMISIVIVFVTTAAAVLWERENYWENDNLNIETSFYNNYLEEIIENKLNLVFEKMIFL
jgi:hypothetical protein